MARRVTITLLSFSMLWGHEKSRFRSPSSIAIRLIIATNRAQHPIKSHQIANISKRLELELAPFSQFCIVLVLVQVLQIAKSKCSR